MRKILTLAVIALLLGAPLRAENPIKEGGKEVGEGFKKMGTGTAEVVKEKGKEAGGALKQGGEDAGREAKKAGKSVEEWFREMWRRIRNIFT
jgi:hypothetical protein